MKVALCRAFGEPLSIEEARLAEPGPGEVKVSLKACSICHSDISYADGIWGGQLPAIYGHEGAGIVKQIGKDIEDFALGDHVIVTLVRHCDDCRFCNTSMQVLCEGGVSLSSTKPICDPDGNELHQAMNCGAFAEEVLVHHSQLQHVSRDIPFDVASLLACGVITGYGAVHHASDFKPGHHVIVIGCGGVGLNSVQSAALGGAASVIAMDLESVKLETARKFGATHAINPAEPNAVDKVMEITGGQGADQVFVTVGIKAAIDSAQGFIGKNGSVIVVGMPPNETPGTYCPGTLTAWSQKIIGTKMGNTIIAQDIPQILSLYAEGLYHLDELISGRFALEQINEAMDDVRSGKAVKNVIIFD